MNPSRRDAQLRDNSKKHSSKSTHTTKIERFGKPVGPDVLLLAGSGSDRHLFILAQSILRQLGPRWEDLLSKRSAKTSKRTFETQLQRLSRLFRGAWFSSAPKMLNLRDDQSNAIRIILLIATMQFTEVPKALDFVDIVQLTDVAVRYDAHSLLAIYMEKWLTPYRERLLSPGYEEWLFVAHHFGYKTEFAELAKYLAINCQVDPSGETLMAPGKSYALGGRISVGSLMRIHESRQLILSKILNTTYALWTAMSTGVGCRVAYTGNRNVQRSCAALNLLVLTDYLRDLQLFPMLKTVATIQRSPKQLAMELSDIKAAMRIAETVSMDRRGSAPVEPSKHVQCHVGFQLKSIISKVLEDVSWSLKVSTASRKKDECENAGYFETNPNVLNVR